MFFLNSILDWVEWVVRTRQATCLFIPKGSWMVMEPTEVLRPFLKRFLLEVCKMNELDFRVGIRRIQPLCKVISNPAPSLNFTTTQLWAELKRRSLLPFWSFKTSVSPCSYRIPFDNNWTASLWSPTRDSLACELKNQYEKEYFLNMVSNNIYRPG